MKLSNTEKNFNIEKSSKICNNSIQTLHLESFHMETDSGKNLKKWDLKIVNSNKNSQLEKNINQI